MVRTMESDASPTLHPLPSDGIRLRRGCSIEHSPNVDLLLTPDPSHDESVNNLKIDQVAIDDNDNIPITVESHIEGRIIIINETTQLELMKQRRKWEAAVTHSIRESKLEV